MADDKPAAERPFIELPPKRSAEEAKRFNRLHDALWRGYARMVREGTWPKGVPIPKSLEHLAPKPEDQKKPVEQAPELTAADEAALDIAWAKVRERNKRKAKQ